MPCSSRSVEYGKLRSSNMMPAAQNYCKHMLGYVCKKLQRVVLAVWSFA